MVKCDGRGIKYNLNTVYYFISINRRSKMNKLNYIITKLRIKLMNQIEYQEYLRTCGVKIGANCDINKTAVFGSEPWLITIDDNVRITQGVKFITHDGGLWTLRKMGLLDDKAVKYGSIHIGKNCNISWDVTFMPGVTIGDNCVIAAGAVVTKNIPSGTIFGGVPARQIESIEEYYEKVKDQCVPTYCMNNREKLEYLTRHHPELLR